MSVTGQSNHAGLPRWRCARIPPSLPSGRRHSFANWPMNSRPRRSQPSAGCICIPTWSTSCLPLPTSRSICATPTTMCSSMPNAEPTSFCSRRSGGLHGRDEEPGPLRSGRVRRFGRRLRRTGGPHPGPHCAPHAVRRRPRRADAGPCLSDRDDLRAIGERAESQPGRVHQPTDLEAGANVLLQVMLELAAT